MHGARSYRRSVTDLFRVVRADKGAVLVLPADGLDGEHEPHRVTLDRDGLLATQDGDRLPPTVGDWLVLDDDGARLRPRRTALVRDTAGATSRVPALRLGETAESCSPGAGTPTDAADHVHGPAVEVQGLFTLPLTEAREAHEGTLPHYFG